MLAQLLQSEPAYRLKQIYQAWFDSKIKSYDEITTLSKELRAQLKDEPWSVVHLAALQTSKIDGTQKALLELEDGAHIETVLMGRPNKRATRTEDERRTICISTQVGCPMGCAFCATGKLGFTRNLTAQEIVDEMRFWNDFCHSRESGNPVSGSRIESGMTISNIVLMGQGEPLLNYDNIKNALNIILENTDIGPSKITLSTCGVPEGMEKMIEDKNFPRVRFALSLHSAIEETRKKIMPSHRPGFLQFLEEWAGQFIGLEYTLLNGINDDDKHLKALIKLASKLGRVRINLIPYNFTGEFSGSPVETVEKWHDALMKAGFTSTIRRSQGGDIAAACGQLSLSQKSRKI